MTYRAPVAEIEFLLTHVLDFDRLSRTDLYSEVTADTARAVLSEIGRLAEEVLYPLNRIGDQHPARLENGVVRTSPGFRDGYRAFAQGGWVGINADPDYGGMGLSLTLLAGLADMAAGANMALALNPMLTQGQIEALQNHAGDAIKALYLPKLISGEWTGTMDLTEPQAGSDVGALRTKAEDKGDGTYSITGQKLFITWGDHDVAKNICHMVLARLPDAPQGTKGISLFMVPKFLPNADGNPGKANSLRTVSLEHKMGIHGSPTALMEFDGATGWMIGEPNSGMAAMFTMMNNARLSVGMQAVGTAEAAFQKAAAYARDRKQGRTPVGDGSGGIIDHADVRRMLLTMKSRITVARALCLDTAISLDMAKATGEKAWAARGAFLTPVAKAFGTDSACEVADLGIQVHGGMGYIEETGAEQYLRDVRIARIYEGTNGIQAMDLVSRKLADGGEAARALLAEVRETVDRLDQVDPDLAALMRPALGALTEATGWMTAQSDFNDRFAGAVEYLRGFALTLGGHYLARAALADTGNADRMALLKFFVHHEVSQVAGLCSAASSGASQLYLLDTDAFLT
jgi:alkylation response protein AidB-like acyl-CoA dehydrogenase